MTHESLAEDHRAQVDVDRQIAVRRVAAVDDAPPESETSLLWSHLRICLHNHGIVDVSESALAAELVKTVADLGWRPPPAGEDPGP